MALAVDTTTEKKVAQPSSIIDREKKMNQLSHLYWKLTIISRLRLLKNTRLSSDPKANLHYDSFTKVFISGQPIKSPLRVFFFKETKRKKPINAKRV